MTEALTHEEYLANYVKEGALMQLLNGYLREFPDEVDAPTAEGFARFRTWLDAEVSRFATRLGIEEAE